MFTDIASASKFLFPFSVIFGQHTIFKPVRDVVKLVHVPKKRPRLEVTEGGELFRDRLTGELVGGEAALVETERQDEKH